MIPLLSRARTARPPRPDQPFAGASLRFADYTFDPERGELRRGSERIALRPQATEVLRRLLLHHPHLVPLEELRQAVWGRSAVEWGAGLHQIVRQLRRALGDDPRAPTFVETVPRRGYRFLVTIETAASGNAGPAPGAPPYLRRATLFWLAGVLTTPVLVLVACWVLAGP